MIPEIQEYNIVYINQVGATKLIATNDSVNTLINGSETIQDLSSFERKQYYINSQTHQYAQGGQNLKCLFYPVSVKGLYKIYAPNSAASYAITISDQIVNPAPLVSDVFVLNQGSTAYVYLHQGEYIYLRDDEISGGRNLPNLYLCEDFYVKDAYISDTMNTCALLVTGKAIKEYVDSHIETKTIKCLFIGNSISQDHVSYVPWLLKNTYPEVNFKICQVYMSGYSTTDYCNNIINDNTPIEIYSVANNTQIWTNYNNSKYWSDIWDDGSFDIICYEGYFIRAQETETENVDNFEVLVDNIKSNHHHPFKLAYLMHQVYNKNYTEDVAWERVVSGVQSALNLTPVSIIFPCGAVTRLVNGDIPESTLTNDSVHNQQGLPCIMGAYTIMDIITRYLGLKSKILNNTLRITSAVEYALNIPGRNGTLQIGTDFQYDLCQNAAVKAVRFADYLIENNSNIQ